MGCSKRPVFSKRVRRKTSAWIVYNGAALDSVATHAPQKFPSQEEAFPSLFEKKEQQDWQIMKARIETYSAMHASLASE